MMWRGALVASVLAGFSGVSHAADLPTGPAIRQQLRGAPVTFPTGRDVLDYIRALWESQASFDAAEKIQCERMKKFLNYLGEGVPGDFLHRIRRSQTREEFFRICTEFLDHDRPMPLEPIPTPSSTT